MAICRAHTEGVINSHQLHELVHRMDLVVPWWIAAWRKFKKRL